MNDAKSKALKVKQKGGHMGFDRSSKVLQGEAKRHGDKVVHFRGYDKIKRSSHNRRPINPDNIPS